SVVGGERIGRYSFVGTNPFLSVTSWDRQVRFRYADGRAEERTSADPLKDLDHLLSQYSCATVAGLPSFCGGAVGYAGYDVIRYTEHLPNIPEDDRGLPDLCFALYDSMVIFDHIRKVLLAVVLADTNEQDADTARRDAEQRLDDLCGQLAAADNSLTLTDIDLTVEAQLQTESNFTQESFEAAVERCRE
ncbi:MAG: anthranilate synthase component I, partial [Planctomycetaceae bacterium]|nr:anthranilate synthase component I [Planctomycetaceae bacterium]